MANTLLDDVVDYVLGDKGLMKKIESELMLPRFMTEDEQKQAFINYITDEYEAGEFDYLLSAGLNCLGFAKRMLKGITA